MQNHKTVEEKSNEWGITSRHVQHLCRSGKIEGAIKRAGSWFIPADTPSPAKRTRSDTKDFKFVGTKSGIFNCAIELFMLKGFNDVSIRDIADAVGIRQSTIYNHFKSKQELLDTIYDYYCHYFLKDRPSLKDMEPVLQDESVMEIIRCIRYEFKEDYEQKLSDITKIIFQRISVDDRAREIGKTLMVEEGIKYVEDVFGRGIEMGRFAPFDTHAIAVFLNSAALFTLLYWIMDPSPGNMAKLVEDAQALYKYAAGFVTDLKPPG